MYGSDYVKVRDAVAGAIYGNLVKELSEVVKVIHWYWMFATMSFVVYSLHVATSGVQGIVLTTISV